MGRGEGGGKREWIAPDRTEAVRDRRLDNGAVAVRHTRFLPRGADRQSVSRAVFPATSEPDAGVHSCERTSRAALHFARVTVCRRRAEQGERTARRIRLPCTRTDFKWMTACSNFLLAFRHLELAAFVFRRLSFLPPSLQENSLLRARTPHKPSVQ